ncbi:MAG: phosphoribosylglycinamide formyltransferase [Bacteroidales bacterium]
MIKRIAIFASGDGSNAENIYSYFETSVDIQVSVILTNNPESGVVDRCRKLDIPLILISKNDLESKILLKLLGLHIDYIVLAGFLLKIPLSIIQAYPNRIINLHPALLPKFGGKGMYGLHVHNAVINAGESESGITIHCVNAEYDKGEILAQFRIAVNKADNAETLQARVHELEYKYFPAVLESFMNRDKSDE